MSDKDSPVALIVDDEKRIRETLADIFLDEGWQTQVARNGKEGLSKFLRVQPDLVLLDVWMTGMDGIETLQKMKEIDPRIPVVVMSGHGTIETAVRATKLGAFDYLEKPLSLDHILPLLDHAREIKNKENREVDDKNQFQLIGSHESMGLIKHQIGLVAPRNSWVLITGENGTGKEVVARNIHKLSTRANKTFVAVNCAAIPEELIESELFGHTKGAFTNALSSKQGKFELAHGGTLFLDEIGDMSLKTQAKILRILQDQKFEKLGGVETLEVDVRVIAATNKDLKHEISAGRFREDLYYRLNVVPFHMPPLRERGNDVVELANYFLSHMTDELGEVRKVLTDGACAVLKAYLWPGNVRELRNILERVCIMVPDQEINEKQLLDFVEIGKDTLESIQITANASTLKQAKTDFERSFILEKLEEYQWNVTKTAEAIGVERSNLHRKIKVYEIDAKRLRG